MRSAAACIEWSSIRVRAPSASNVSDTASTQANFQSIPTVVPAPGQIQGGMTDSAPATDAQTQIDALSKQLSDLQQSVAANKAADGAQAK